MGKETTFAGARTKFHAGLLVSVLRTDEDGIPSNADKHSDLSISISKGISDRLKSKVVGKRLPGQTSGLKFEEVCTQFLVDTFLKLQHLRPGKWEITRVGSNNRLEIAKYEQYAHLIALDKAAKKDPELAAALGSDYTITPDIIIVRNLEEEVEINTNLHLVDGDVARLASIRKLPINRPLLHASISSKWTLRSDRAQNARSEGLNLVRNRKGHLPHVVVVTGEPTPNRIASIALGTGDIDCVYHFALDELADTIRELGLKDAEENLLMMVSGKRLKDISDLPLDLAV